MIRNAIRAAGILLATLTIPAGVLAASPSASASGGASNAMAAGPIRVISQAKRVNNFILYLNSSPPGGNIKVACNGGATHTVSAGAALEELSGRNNCSVRVWLHQNPDGSGRALCIRPHSLATLKRAYRQIQITHNTATC